MIYLLSGTQVEGMYNGGALGMSGRLSAVIAAVLILIGSARIVSTYNALSGTLDEPAHLGGGMQWLEAHKYDYDDLHPPLARIAGAIGLHFEGIHWKDGLDEYTEGFHLLGGGEHYQRALFSSRIAMLPFFWLGSVVVYLWGLRAGGPLAAVYSTLLFTALPPVLAHAGLVTNDMALTSCMGFAVLVSLDWCEKPNWKWNVVFGVSLGLAALSKFSALVFLPFAWGTMYVVSVASRRVGFGVVRSEVKRCVAPALAALGVGFLVIWAGYRFSYGKVEYLHNKVPAPMFFNELAGLFNYHAGAHIAYVFGKVSVTGFWYYYPAVLCIKTPIALLILVGAAAAVAFRRGDPWKVRQPLAMALGVLLFAMFFVQLNIGVRHVLPVYAAFAVAGGLVCAHWPRIAIGLLLSWYVVSGALQHPEYIAYTNEIAGRHPENFVADSDLDWGQDMGRLAGRLEANQVAKVWTNCDEGYMLSGNRFPEYHAIPEGAEPPAGWTAVCVTGWKLDNHPPWAGRFQPKERVGKSILLFYIGP